MAQGPRNVDRNHQQGDTTAGPERTSTTNRRIIPQVTSYVVFFKFLPLIPSRYIVITNKLSECVDQLAQPQKKKFARRILELVLGRILELKFDLVESDLCEYTYCGDTIDFLKLTPQMAELQVSLSKFLRLSKLKSSIINNKAFSSPLLISDHSRSSQFAVSVFWSFSESSMVAMKAASLFLELSGCFKVLMESFEGSQSFSHLL